MSRSLKYTKSGFRRLNFLLIIVIGFEYCLAQDNIIYGHHMLHPGLTNPAASGSEFFPVIAFTYQKQWLGFPHSPQTFIASTSLRLGNFDFYNPKMFLNKSSLKAMERVGFGLGIYSDREGVTINRGLLMNYSYHIALSRSRLSFGLSGNAEQTIVDGTLWDPIDPNDPNLNYERKSYFMFNANFGIYYYSETYFTGFAINHLIPVEDKLQPDENIKQDYIINGGYLFNRMGAIKFEPSLNIRYLDYDKVEFDLITKLYFQHVHWLAISYRSYKAISAMVGFKIRKFYIAYSFEANLTSAIKYSAGTHGVHLGFNLGMRRMEGF